MIRPRTARPRRIGLLTSTADVRRLAIRPAQRLYPYALGDRIAGDLTVIGHLAPGRLGHLYQVWSAHDWCALTCKILSPDLRDSRRAVAALRREARILRRMHHPNIIRGFGEGEHEGLTYLLMEYVEGPSLFDLLERRPNRRLDVPDGVRMAIHIGAGLYHLHRRGWLHLDLKPANLLLREGIPVLVDFDAARPIDLASRPLRRLGTAPYMAPEQVLREPLGPQADVYGLGALLYEMVTGRWPFEDVYTGDEPRSGAERQHPQIGTHRPPPPRRFNAEIPASLDRTIMRCLDPDAAERFPSMHPLLLALAAELDEPVALWPVHVRTERRQAPRD
ncbi:MAG: serine/threonine protein kinase [Gemmatimonadetes bacterium]|nr:serine/threonine protein kinase [Gemmatimonadota bacterium]